MKAVIRSALVVVVFLLPFAPRFARADHGWRQSAGRWLYYTDINQMRHWYAFDPAGGRWLYWNKGSWDFISSYRPPQVVLRGDELRRLPESFRDSANFYAAPDRRPSSTVDGEASEDTATMATLRRIGWLRRRHLRCFRE